MLLSDSDNRFSAATRAGRPVRAAVLVTCFCQPRRSGPAAHAAAALSATALNGIFAAVLMFLYRNGAM